MQAPLSPHPPFPMRRKPGDRDGCRCVAQRLMDSCGATPPDNPRWTKPTREVEHFRGTSARAFISTWGHRFGVGQCILPRRRRALRGGWRGSVAGVDSIGFPMRFLAGHCLVGGTSTALKLAKSRDKLPDIYPLRAPLPLALQAGTPDRRDLAVWSVKPRGNVACWTVRVCSVVPRAARRIRRHRVARDDVEPHRVLTDRGRETGRRAMGATHISHDARLRLAQRMTS
jgi:hypothetical protein